MELGNTDMFLKKNVEEFNFENKLCKIKKDRRTNVLCMTIILFCGILNIFLALLSISFNFQTEYVRERMKMRSGFPPMEIWRKPNVRVLVGIYLYNITNAEEFLQNSETKLKIQEVGPILYQQLIEQKDIIFHEHNSTMSYTTHRFAKFLPDENEEGILNKTIMIPNSALLGLASYINEESFIKKIAFNIISGKDHVILKRTVYEALWNNSIPVLNSLKEILPFLVPRTNTGILYNIFHPVQRRFNVKIGPDISPNEFFIINKYNNQEKIPGYEYEDRDCSISFNNTRDGTCFPPFMAKNLTINIWRDDLCRTYPFEFEEEVQHGSFLAYKYGLNNDIYKRFDDPDMDCFRGEKGIELPDGLIDSSKCAFATIARLMRLYFLLDLPVAYSNPNFYGFTGPWENYISGLRPNKKKHSSYFVIEPEAGVLLSVALRAQYNVPVPDLRGFNKYLQRFKNMVVPSFWAEYVMKDTTTFIELSIKMYYLLPVIQPVLILFFSFSGMLGIIFSVKRLRFIKRKRKNVT